MKVFLKKKKNKKQQCGHELCKNLPVDEKQKLVEYRKKIQNEKKCLIIIENYFHLENPVFHAKIFLEECKYI